MFWAHRVQGYYPNNGDSRGEEKLKRLFLFFSAVFSSPCLFFSCRSCSVFCSHGLCSFSLVTLVPPFVLAPVFLSPSCSRFRGSKSKISETGLAHRLALGFGVVGSRSCYMHSGSSGTGAFGESECLPRGGLNIP